MKGTGLAKKSSANSAVLVRVLVVIIVLPIIYITLHNQHHATKAAANTTPVQNILSYSQCVTAPGSSLQQTAPKVCIAPSGIRFTQSVAPAATGNAGSSEAASKYIVLKEWGVQGSYAQPLTLEYRLVQGDKVFKDAALFTSAELLQADTSPTCNINSLNYGAAGNYYPSGAGVIVRVAANQPVNLTAPNGLVTQTAQAYAATLNSNDYVKVGNYYFFSPDIDGPCGEAADLISLTQQAVESVLHSLVTVP